MCLVTAKSRHSGPVPEGPWSPWLHGAVDTMHSSPQGGKVVWDGIETWNYRPVLIRDRKDGTRGVTLLHPHILMCTLSIQNRSRPLSKHS